MFDGDTEPPPCAVSNDSSETEGPVDDEIIENKTDKSPLLAPPKKNRLKEGPRGEDFVQSPIAKFRLRGKMPFKLLLNVVVIALLLFFMTCEVSSSRADADQTRHLARWLLGGVPSLADKWRTRWTTNRRGDVLKAVAAVAGRFHNSGAETDFAMPSVEPPWLRVVLSRRSFRFNPTEASCQGVAATFAGDSPWLSKASGTVEVLDHVLANDTTESMLYRLLLQQDQRTETSRSSVNAQLSSLCAARPETFGSDDSWYAPCLPSMTSAVLSNSESSPFKLSFEDNLCGVVLAFRLRRSLTSDVDVFSQTTFLFTPMLVCDRTAFGGFRCKLRIDTKMQRSHSNPVLALALLAALALSSLIDIGLRVKAIAKLLWFRRQRRDDTASDEERDREDRRRSLAAERIDWVGSSNKGSDKFAEKWKRALLKDLGASWHYWAILCHLFCIAYVGIAVCEVFEATVTSSTAVAKRLLLGCACFTSSLQFLGFLRFFPRVYFLIKVTRRSMPKVLSMLAAAVPIFVGSVCFATIVFGSALSSGDDGSRGEFDTFSSTATALFTATFGDSLLAAFRTTQRDSGGGSDGIGRWIQRSIGGVFIVLYVFVFMSVVLNVALAIVMETFGELRETFGVAVLDHSPDCNDRDGDERVQGANEAAAQKVLDGLEELVAYATFPEATTRD